MKRANNISAFFLCLSLAISPAIACVPLLALEEGDHFSRFGMGMLDVTEEYLEAYCKQYVQMQNDFVHQGLYEGDFLEYKHFWCLNEYELEYNPVADAYVHYFYYGAIYNIEIEDLIIGLMDELIIPALPADLQKMVNAGDPACQPDCAVGEGINPYTAHFHYEENVMSIDVVDLSFSYNSIIQQWTSRHDAELSEYITSTSEGLVKIQAVFTGDGRAHPMVLSQDGYFCSADGTRGGFDALSDEFTAAMSNRILKFLPDGRLKEVVLRDIDRSINLDRSISGEIVVSTLNGQAGYRAQLDGNGRPTLVESLDSSNPATASLTWDSSGNLISTIVAGHTTSFLYLDPNNPKLLTDIIEGNDEKKTKLTYDQHGRVVKQSVMNADWGAGRCRYT